jgi:hypothetical protein
LCRASWLCAFTLHLQSDGQGRTPHDAGVEATTKLQKAGRTFLLRLVAMHGPDAAARILRRLADEIDALAYLGRGLSSPVAVVDPATASHVRVVLGGVSP